MYNKPTGNTRYREEPTWDFLIRNTAISAARRSARLSPWFSDRRHSTKAEILAQLDYREENKTAVAAFHPTRKLGKYTKLLLDEEAKKFAVTGASDLVKANPDILDYSQARDCRLDIDESRHELKQKDAEGKLVSYDPPQYEYSYDFHVEIDVEHPYIDTIRFSLSNGYIKTGDRPSLPTAGAWQVNTADGMNPRMQDYYAMLDLGNEIKAAVDEMRFGPAPAPEQVPGMDTMPDGIPQPDSEPSAIPAAPPKEAVVCPWCGLTTIPDDNGCCEFCTGTLFS